jgi:hypothetical protein
MSDYLGGRWLENTELQAGESVIDEQAARCTRGAFTMRGRLFVTNQRLLFCPTRNILGQRHRPVTISFSDISKIGTGGPGKFVRFLVLGRNTDSWFVAANDEQYWFDLGHGWNEMWLQKFAKRLGLEVQRDETSG